ncbi:MAG: DUF4388 domain-containing protein [Polyangiaceae bacterium]|nr:DUF4388 domain-containing protein [Polyangiaceae bacterium]
MTNNNRRFDPRRVFDSDWRKTVWKRWLRSTLANAAETMGATAAEATAAEAEPPAPGPPPLASRPPPRDPERERDARRSELRARFDALSDRLASIEDTLDALGKRLSLKAVHERRQEQRLLERIESGAEMLERQTFAIEASQAALERLEQRMARWERRGRYDGGNDDTAEKRPRYSVPVGLDDRDLNELEDAFGDEPQTGRRSTPPEACEIAPVSGSSIQGDLSEMSLPTVLAMLELERRTGVLRVCGEDGSVVTATLRSGSIVGAKRSEVDADPVEVIREAMRYQNGHFWFRQSSVEVVSGPPRSVGSVLLEASSRNDEAARTG